GGGKGEGGGRGTRRPGTNLSVAAGRMVMRCSNCARNSSGPEWKRNRRGPISTAPCDKYAISNGAWRIAQEPVAAMLAARCLRRPVAAAGIMLHAPRVLVLPAASRGAVAADLAKLARRVDCLPEPVKVCPVCRLPLAEWACPECLAWRALAAWAACAAEPRTSNSGWKTLKRPCSR